MLTTLANAAEGGINHDFATWKTHVKSLGVIILVAAAIDVAAAAPQVPLPRPRPAALGDRLPPVSQAAPRPEPSACQAQLTKGFAIARSLAPIEGPEGCGGPDLVRLEAI